MKKFTTTFFLLMAMVLLLPTGVKAWGTLNLRSSVSDNWTGTNDALFTQGIDDNHWTKEINARNITGDISFRIYINTNNEQIYPKSGNGIELGNGMSTSDYYQNSNETTWCWKIPHSTTKFDKYIITANYINDKGWKWVISVIGKNFDAYVPTLDNKDEISCFVEVPSTINEVKIWAWNDSYNYSMNVESSTDWGNRPSMTYMGETISGNKVYKWTYTGTQTGTPSSVIFTKGDADTDKFADEIDFTNHGYYVYDGTNNIGSSSKTITDVSGGETTTTATLAYGSKSVEGTEADGVYTFANIPYTAFNGTSVSFQLKTVTDGVTTYYNMPNGTTSINAGQGYTVETSATGSDWTYAKTTAPNKGTFTVTLNTADNTVTLTDNTSYIEAPTPVTGQNLYLVGNFMFTEGDNINYDCEYFKLKDNGDNTYSIDIPATITVNFQLLTSDGVNKVIYGPTDGKCSINTTNPQKTKTVTGELADTEQTLSNYWAMSDRSSGVQNKEEAGMYTVTVTVDENGTPVEWSITHDNLTRVAYFLSDMEHAALQPSYNTRTQATQAFNNVHFGNVYLPAGAKCYVVSNIGGDVYSGGGNDMLQTKTKLYLQGNGSGKEPDGGDDNTKVYPIAGGAKPFMVSETESTSGLFEYAPARGHGSYVYDGIKGEVILKKVRGDKEGTILPSIQSMKISGPGVGNDTWKLDDAVVMTYNPSDNCWEATINTTAPAGNKFRFVANDDWNVNWGEDGIAARIPYDGDGEGSPATIKEPNEVEVDLGGTSYSSHDDVSTIIPDIIFNRNGGRWTIKFYIETIPVVGEENFTYKFSYTINGYRSVLRTYCMPENRKPTDENIKIYGAYAFDDESGKVKLYEMNYIPANEGVILIGTGVDYVEAAEYTPTEGETKYKNIADDKYKNYLVGVLAATKVNASVFDGNKRIGRNFFFNYLSDTGYYEDGATDYLGFFRIKSGSTCKANHAYLHLPTTVLTWNGQTLDDVLEDETSTLSKGFKLTFGIADEDFGFVTGINDVQKKVKIDNSYYTLQGIRVNTPSKGIYIHNGKKVVIK